MKAVESGITVDKSSTKNQTQADIAPEIPDSLSALSAKEKKVWKYLTESLMQYGLVHLTDSLVLSVICKTYIDWVNVEKELDDFRKSNKGSIMVETPNGFAQQHQLFFAARALKKELKEWLPEALLTIPSFQKAVGDLANPNQGGLFDDDPVEKHRANKAKIGMVAVAND